METPSPFRIQVPDFKSEIPEHLLLEASPQDKWIMENLSVLTQKADWHTAKLVEGADSFERLSVGQKRIEELQKIANGRTSKNEELAKKLNEEMEAVRFVKKWGSKKFVWVFITIIFLVGIPYVASVHFTIENFAGIIKLLFGA
jgi:hypothetical protein